MFGEYLQSINRENTAADKIGWSISRDKSDYYNRTFEKLLSLLFSLYALLKYKRLDIFGIDITNKFN